MTEQISIEILKEEIAIYKYNLYESPRSEYLGQATRNIYEERISALEMAIKALEQEPQTDNRVKTELNGVKTELEPCEDCISRNALYNELYEHFHDEDAPNNITEVRLGTVRNFVKNFPSIKTLEQEPQTDIIDKIRAEIEELIEWHDCPIELDGGNDAWYCEAVKQCVEIIDKYRQEG